MPDGGLANDLVMFPQEIQAAEGSGPDAVSLRGALGVMQVMPSTAADPGFGVEPASGPNDLTRVGDQYAQAMLRRYAGNEVLAAAAYNAGPGRVDRWLRDIGDPRGGEMTNAEWVARLPFPETRAYAGKFLGGAIAEPMQLAGDVVPFPEGGARPPLSSYPSPWEKYGTDKGFNPLFGPGWDWKWEQILKQPYAPANEAETTGSSAQVALRLLQLALPNHRIQPVDYDPWAIAKVQRASA